MKREVNSLTQDVARLKSDVCRGIELPGAEVVRFVRVHPVAALASVVVAGVLLGQSRVLSRGMGVTGKLAIRWAFQSLMTHAMSFSRWRRVPCVTVRHATTSG